MHSVLQIKEDKNLAWDLAHGTSASIQQMVAVIILTIMFLLFQGFLGFPQPTWKISLLKF